jgi:hypothetical protein
MPLEDLVEENAVNESTQADAEQDAGGAGVRDGFVRFVSELPNISASRRRASSSCGQNR